MSTKLELYVDQDCPGCEYARSLANRVRIALPQVEVRIVDLGDPSIKPPLLVFAVPTYLLNGKTIALGNPDYNQLLVLLQEDSAGWQSK